MGKLLDSLYFHFHMHLIPRYGEGDGFGAVWKTHTSEYTPEDLTTIADSISTTY